MLYATKAQNIVSIENLRICQGIMHGAVAVLLFATGVERFM